MVTRAITDTGDWTFGKGKQNYRIDSDGLKQRLKTRIQSWLGDCFFASNDGVDWLNYLDKGMKDFLDIDIKRAMLQTEEVLQIAEYSSILNQESRTVTITATVNTIYGPIQFDQTVGGA